MTSNDPGVPEYRYMAAMWAHAVAVYHVQLDEAVQQFQSDQIDSQTRRQFKDASDEERAQWADHIARATNVLTIASLWRMGMDRVSLLNAAAQLRKCTIALQDRGVSVPQIRDQKFIRLLRDVDEHWEQVDRGRSLAELRQSMPHEGPGRIEYTNKHVWIGGFNTYELFLWSREVDEEVRQDAELDGCPIPGIDEPLDEFLDAHRPPD